MGAISTKSNKQIKINQQSITNKNNNTLSTKPLTSSHVTTIGTKSNSLDHNQKQQHTTNNTINYKNTKSAKLPNFRKTKNPPLTNINTPNKQNIKYLQKNQKRNQSAVHLHPFSKLRCLENNKKFLQQSIQTTICVQRMLNLLCHRQILANSQYNSLIAQNIKSLQSKQKKYRKLQAKQHRMRLQKQQTEQPVNKNTNKLKQTSSLYAERQNNKKRILPRVIQYHNKSKFAFNQS